MVTPLFLLHFLNIPPDGGDGLDGGVSGLGLVR